LALILPADGYCLH